jgi:hypothetical protein
VRALNYLELAGPLERSEETTVSVRNADLLGDEDQ